MGKGVSNFEEGDLKQEEVREGGKELKEEGLAMREKGGGIREEGRSGGGMRDQEAGGYRR